MSELAPRIPVSLVSCLPPLLAELSFSIVLISLLKMTVLLLLFLLIQEMSYFSHRGIVGMRKKMTREVTVII